MCRYLFLLLAINFAQLDHSFTWTTDYAAVRDELVNLLPDAESGAEKAGLLWRISRAWLMVGQEATARDEKRACFAEGIRYADQAIKENPKDPQGYMWHCANIGLDCQTRKVMEQAAAVPKMSSDLTMILDKLGRVDCSEAWQALSEIWWAHPFKSSDAAINFARKAAMTIPKDEMRIGTLTHLAELLYKRDWSAQKRAEEAAANKSKYAKPLPSNIDHFAYLDGAPEAELAAPWNSAGFTALSDREEALAIAAYAQQIYRNCSAPTPVDKSDYIILTKLLKQWQ